MKTLLIIILFFALASCSINKEVSKFYGKYSSKIEISTNKTFEYHTVLGVGEEIIRKGTWTHHKGDTILLNTYNQPINKTTTYNGKINPNLKNKIRISISDFELKLPFALVEINNGEMVKSTDSIGVVEFETNKITNITYNIMGEISEEIKISNPELNEIDILIRDLDLEIVPQYFTNKPIVITNRKVVFYPNKTEKRFELKRRNISEKYWD